MILGRICTRTLPPKLKLHGLDKHVTIWEAHLMKSSMSEYNKHSWIRRVEPLSKAGISRSISRITGTGSSWRVNNE